MKRVNSSYSQHKYDSINLNLLHFHLHIMYTSLSGRNTQCREEDMNNRPPGESVALELHFLFVMLL